MSKIVRYQTRTQTCVVLVAIFQAFAAIFCDVTQSRVWLVT